MGEVPTYIKLAIEISTMESVLVTQWISRRPNRRLEEGVRNSSLKQTSKINGYVMILTTMKKMTTTVNKEKTTQTIEEVI